MEKLNVTINCPEGQGIALIVNEPDGSTGRIDLTDREVVILVEEAARRCAQSIPLTAVQPSLTTTVVLGELVVDEDVEVAVDGSPVEVQLLLKHMEELVVESIRAIITTQKATS